VRPGGAGKTPSCAKQSAVAHAHTLAQNPRAATGDEIWEIAGSRIVERGCSTSASGVRLQAPGSDRQILVFLKPETGRLKPLYSRNPGFTETRLRPLALRREITARPCLVFIRVRKPCTFERRRRFGWNVRFGMEKSYAPVLR